MTNRKSIPAVREKSRKRKLKILMVGTEVAPYASVGGFSMVLAYLSRALAKDEHDVRLFMPKFGSIDEKKYKTELVYEGLEVPTGDEIIPILVCNVKKACKPDGVTIYFLENQEYYEKRANVYGYMDDPTRWALLSRGVLEFIRTKTFVPDVIHANDWHTGLVPNYLKTIYKKDPVLKNIVSVFTIHNLRHQGMFDHKHVTELDFDDGKSRIATFFEERLRKQNFMRRGIIYADAVNTVSKTYSREMLTPEFGEGLDKLLVEVRGKLFGIVNGLDYDEFNPAKDNLIEQNYGRTTLGLRAKNKVALQREYNLPEDEGALLLGFVGRLDWQKGIDLIIETLRHVLPDYNVQFVQVGGGDGGVANMLYALREEFPDKVGIHPHLDFTLSRVIFAGADCILMPSRFEPCGVVQIEAMRYGAIPIVRKIGGLADTVENFNSAKLTGTGLVFTNFDEFSLFGQIVRAIELHSNPKVWRKLQLNALRADFSWDFSAGEYVRLYERATSFRLKKKNPQRKLAEEVTFNAG